MITTKESVVNKPARPLNAMRDWYERHPKVTAGLGIAGFTLALGFLGARVDDTRFRSECPALSQAVAEEARTLPLEDRPGWLSKMFFGSAPGGVSERTSLVSAGRLKASSEGNTDYWFDQKRGISCSIYTPSPGL